jgi:predicted transcriptional regulator
MYTTVRVEQKTKQKLEEIKNYEKEPIDSVIERLITNSEEDNMLSENEIIQLEKGLKNIKEGKVKTLESAIKEWGV